MKTQRLVFVLQMRHVGMSQFQSHAGGTGQWTRVRANSLNFWIQLILSDHMHDVL